MVFISHNHRLAKNFTFDIIPNSLFTEETIFGNKFYTSIKYTPHHFYNITLDELKRYNHEIIDIDEIYPYNTQDEKNYFKIVSPNKVIKDGTHSRKEMLRYNKVIKAITEYGINKDTFDSLISFVLDQLIFTHLSEVDRTAIFNFGQTQMTTIPENITRNLIYMIEILDALFKNYNGPEFKFRYKIHNNRNHSDFSDTTFPVIIHTDDFKLNIDYVFNNIPDDYIYDDTAIVLPDTIQENYTHIKVTSNRYQLTLDDEFISVDYDGPVEIILPLISTLGRHTYHISDISGKCEKNFITIKTSGGNLILRSETLVMNDNFSSVILYNDDDTNWLIT